jgi:hypothetical protein
MNILNIRFELRNPFDRWDYFKNLGGVYRGLWGFKAWELEHTYYSPLLFDFELCWTTQVDHAGFEFGIGILGYGIHFRIYDTRHWNDYDRCWEQRDYSEYFEINS